MDVTVCTGTFGDAEWAKLARTRAWPTVVAEKAPWVHVHGTTLHGARNAALEQVATEWVVFLDADDELAPGYLQTLLDGAADLRVPSVEYIKPDGAAAKPPYVPVVPGHDHECSAECMEDGNYAVVGSMARTELVRAAGGFLDEECYEDWSLWLRMVRAGASVETIPQAVYRAHARRDSRNRALTMDTKNRVHRQIVASLAA